MRGTIRDHVKEILWQYRRFVTAFACIITAMGVLAAITLTVKGGSLQTDAGIQQGIAGEIIRFHVLANSDSNADQELKMQVKEEIVAYMAEVLELAEDLDQTRDLISENLEKIEELAKQTIKREGYDYSVSAELTECYFPMKSYGDCTFPAGEYEALRVCIGEAAGKNWWCVLYPNLCFIDSIHAVVPEEQKEELKNVLTEEEYSSLFDWKKSEYKITTKWFGNNQ